MRHILVACALGMSAAASAHHSYSVFDLTQQRSVSGSIAKVEWSNPHTFVWVYVPGKRGQQDLYAFENGSVNMLKRYGWTASTLAVGEKVTVKYFPLRDGRNGGSFIQATHADGRVTSGDPYGPGGAKLPAGSVDPAAPLRELHP